jgi:hypothetical protein
MKKILFIFLILLSMSVKSQTSFDFSNGYSWKLSGVAYCGVGNAYCLVTRSAEVSTYGTYSYNIYFSSNSFLANCVASNTYIPNIIVVYYDINAQAWLYPINYNKFWITANKMTLAYTLFHSDPNLKIKINVGTMTPTIY